MLPAPLTNNDRLVVSARGNMETRFDQNARASPDYSHTRNKMRERGLLLALLVLTLGASPWVRAETGVMGVGVGVGATTVGTPIVHSVDIIHQNEDLYYGLDLTDDVSLGEDDVAAESPEPAPQPQDPGDNVRSPETEEADILHELQEERLGDPEDAHASASNVVVAPSPDALCPTTSGAKAAVNKATRRQRIKIIFMVVLPAANTTKPETFDATEARLVSALERASRAMGAQHHFGIKVNTIEYIQGTESRRKAFSRRLYSESPSTPASTFQIRITGEADFAGEDEMVASEIHQLLTDAPTSIFPESEFGIVHVPDAILTETELPAEWIVPLAATLGALAALTIACILVFIASKRPSMPSADINMDMYDGFIPPDLKALSGRGSQGPLLAPSLLPQPSSKEYTAPNQPKTKEYNNLGYY